MMEVNAPGYYVVRVDDCVDESLVYLTGNTLRYPVIFDEKKNAHNPKAFTGERHYLTLRPAAEWELGNRSHGRWPYASWGINKQDDAELTLDFGRLVDFDTIVLSMERSYEPHRFAITRKGITWIKLGNLIKADDPSPFPALTQIEVYGTDAK